MSKSVAFLIPENINSEDLHLLAPDCDEAKCKNGIGMCVIFAVIGVLIAAKYIFQGLGVPKLVLCVLVTVGAKIIIRHLSCGCSVANQPAFSYSVESEESLECAEHNAAFLAEQHEEIGDLLDAAEITVERLRARNAAAAARRELAQMKQILRDHTDAKNTLLELADTAEALAECKAAIELAKEQ